MKMWHYLPDALEDRLSFVRFVESEVDFNEPIAIANTIFTVLWPVMQPLSVTLEMAARPREFPFIERDIPVPVRSWHLLGMGVPAHIAIAKWAEWERIDPSEYSEETIPELTPQALADWLARAHAQQLTEGYIPVLDTLEIHYTRARLLENQEPYAELAWGSETYAVPVEKREDGLWVSGPIRKTMINHPPIEISLVNFHGRLGLRIAVYWSPWFEVGSAEAGLLRTCLLELENQGWEGEKP
jgi:hypothetical protein